MVILIVKIYHGIVSLSSNNPPVGPFSSNVAKRKDVLKPSSTVEKPESVVLLKSAA